VVTAVAYTHSFAYLSDRDSGKLFSGLRLAISSPEKRVRTVDTVAQLDTGSDFSIFDGQLLVGALGIDLMDGPVILLASSGGFSITGRIHPIEILHPDLGRFTLDAAISTVPIRRNLLGHDFFQRIQIGFREFHRTFLITAAP